MHSAVAQVDVMGLGQVLLNLAVAGKALHLGQTLLELVEDQGRERTAFARRLVDAQQRREAPGFVECQPRLDGVPMDR